MKGSEPTMPVNGAETLVDTKTTQPPAGDGRNSRAIADSKAASVERYGDTAPARSTRQFKDKRRGTLLPGQRKQPR